MEFNKNKIDSFIESLDKNEYDDLFIFHILAIVFVANHMLLSDYIDETKKLILIEEDFEKIISQIRKKITNDEKYFKIILDFINDRDFYKVLEDFFDRNDHHYFDYSVGDSKTLEKLEAKEFTEDELSSISYYLIIDVLIKNIDNWLKKYNLFVDKKEAIDDLVIEFVNELCMEAMDDSFENEE